MCSGPKGPHIDVEFVGQDLKRHPAMRRPLCLQPPRLTDDSLRRCPSAGVPGAERLDRDAERGCTLRLRQPESRPDLPNGRRGMSHRSRRCHCPLLAGSEWIAMRIGGSQPFRNWRETAESISVGRFRPVAVSGAIAALFRGPNLRLEKSGQIGAPGRTRTFDPRLRRPVLYPTELRAREAPL